MSSARPHLVDKMFPGSYSKFVRRHNANFCCPRFNFLFHVAIWNIRGEDRRQRERIVPRTNFSGQKRDVSGDNSPAFWKADPRLALAAPEGATVNRAFKLQRNLSVIRAESNDIQPPNTSR